MVKLTQQQFLDRSKRIHGDKYDYSRAIYIDARCKVCIICKIHGQFYQKAIKHLCGQGCRCCGCQAYGYTRRKNVDDFIADAVAIHGKKYDYGKVQYCNSIQKVTITCLIHGDFSQRPQDHLAKHAGCPACYGKSHSQLGRLLRTAFPDWMLVPNKRIWTQYGAYKSRRHCDYWLEKGNIRAMVEYDGEQHFRPVRFGGMPLVKAKKQFKKQAMIDRLDKRFCKENGIVLHRVAYCHDMGRSVSELATKLKN